MRKRPRNYDMPFEEIVDENLIDYYDIEDIHNTETLDINEVFPPSGSFTNLPADVFLGQEGMNLIDDYRKFKEYEELENLD